MNIKYLIDNNGCFICTSHAIDREGYPQMKKDKKHWRLHRFIYTECFGEIPKGLVIRHKCDNRKCINPEHLEVGTHQDNVKDRVERNRSAIGIHNGRSKLNEKQVREIKSDNTHGTTYLAKLYGVDPKSIRDIKQGKAWKHVI